MENNERKTFSVTINLEVSVTFTHSDKDAASAEETGRAILENEIMPLLSRHFAINSHKISVRNINTGIQRPIS